MDNESQQSTLITIIDDDKLILATLSRELSGAGYLVTTLSSSETALEHLRQSPPDLTLLDIRMPGKSGLELATELKNENLPFVFLSAFSDKNYVETARENGALGYIVKPIEIDKLIPQIEAALGRAEELEQLKNTEMNLKIALKGDRSISVAVGLMMERHHLNEEAAFEKLRTSARSERRKLSELCSELISATETVNLIDS